MNSKTDLSSLADKKRALLELLRRERESEQPKISRRHAGGPAPLSSAQRRLWFLDQLAPGNSVYNVAVAHRLSGPLDARALEAALRAVVNRHEPLLYCIESSDGDPVQRPAGADFSLALVDLSRLPSPERLPEAVRRATEAARRPFSLSAGPLFRASLFRLGPDEHVLQFDVHHIVSDGSSVDILYRELSIAYESIRVGKPVELPELPVHFADFVRWQQDQIASDRLRKQLDYWRRALSDAPQTLLIPTDRVRPARQQFAGAKQLITVPADLASEAKRFSSAHGVSLFTTLTAAYGLLLSRHSGQRDLVIGFPVAGRNAPELESLIGFFVNMLPLRFELSPDMTFAQLLASVSERVLEASENQDVPLERIIDAQHIERSPSRTPLFQAVFSLNHDLVSGPALAGVTAEPVPIDTGTAKFDLALEVLDEATGLFCALEYNTSIFEARTAGRMLGHYQNLLRSALQSPSLPVSRLPLLDESEIAEVVVFATGVVTDFGRAQSLPAQFEKIVATHPHAVAAIFGEQEVTYAELNRRANMLARHLHAIGIRPGIVVGGSFERSIDMIVSLLAVLKTGASYLPLDPSYPAERLRFMVEDTSAGFVLSSNAPLEAISDIAKPICLKNEEQALARHEATNLGVHVDSEAAAYIMFTSGSTGRPKGIRIPHRAIARMVTNAAWLAVGPQDRVSHVSNTSFDAALYEIWGALLTGATLVGFARTTVLDVHRFLADVRKHRISRLFVTTALFHQLVREIPDAFKDLDCVMFGGELCDPRAVRTVLKQGAPGRLLHMYGPAECTTFATHYDCASIPEDADTVPIGKPISNTDVFILDEHLQLAPIGVLGQIYTGGDGLALGYLNRPELTRERFIDHPFVAGKRLYATGDLGYFRADGNIEFCGRKDNQIKLRGFRIELDEIETVCRTHPAVADAVVLLRKDSPDIQRLVAFVTGRTGVLTAPEIRAYLQKKLPDYMVPSLVTALEKFPLTANGKTDRAALQSMKLDETRQDGSWLPPQTEIEKTIAGVWQEVLGVERIGRTENFFDLGGHSILLLRVQSRLENALGREIPVVTLFEHPTVATLAEHLTGVARERAIEAAPEKQHEREPIAIVGMAGRFPGASDVEQLWRNLRDGISGVRFFSDEELEAAGVPREVFSQPNYVKAGGVVEGADLFDARYFGMNPREAEITDPQHRVFLECAHEALENAGCDPAAYRGSIGVFAGSSAGSYIDNLRSNPAVAQTAGPLQLLVGNDKDFVSTRVSYKLNLRGPSVNVQTACSTSLVAVHMACQSLLEHACDTALAGGVCIRFPQPSGYPYLEESIMAPDGRCRTFDADAHGTVPASGAAVVVLKRLSDALADRDRIYAVIKGSAINNDGSMKVGYTAPSVEGQAQVIAAALTAAAVDPATVNCVEAHGTGTHLGDPIEIAALTKAFRARTDLTGFCAIGSAKSNLGHLDAAAGVAGLIKAALQLHHQQIAPSLHFERPNPKIDFANSPFFVNPELREWPAGATPRRAAVSSFGIGGTNAHVVLEEAPASKAADPDPKCHVLPLSAKTQHALEQAAANLAGFLRAHPETRLADVAYTLQTGRTAHSRRVAIACESREAAIEALTVPSPAVSVKDHASASLAFLFPGQGSQHVDMGRHLYDAEPVFRREMDRCAEMLVPHLGGVDIRGLLYPDSPIEAGADSLNQTAMAQPALFSVEYALAQLWLSWGVRPGTMIGHSIGEYVAACLAGVLGLDDALRLVARRGRLMQDLPKGAMLAVAMSEPEALEFAGHRLSVAAVNAPRMCVLSGPEEQIAWAESELADRLFHRRLRTSHAFHSAMVDAALDEFRREVSSVKLSPPRIPYLSNVTGTWILPSETTDPEYWVRHLRGCVRFHAGVEELKKNGTAVYLEVGPGNALASLARPSLADAALVCSLGERGRASTEPKLMRAAACRLWESGIVLNWSAIADPAGRHISLPTYPFERQRYWVSPGNSNLESAARKNKKNDFRDWFYLPSWSRTTAVTSDLPFESGSRWLLFADTIGVAEQLASDLEANDAIVTSVVAGEGFACLRPGVYSVHPSSPLDYRRLLSELSDRDRLPHKIVHLWNVSEGAELEHGYYSLLWLAQAAAEHPGQKMDIVAVASNTVNLLGNEKSNPLKAPAIGVARVLPQEFMHLTCRVVDIDRAESKSTVALQIRNECARPAVNDTVVAYRGSFRWTEQFEKTELVRSGNSRLLKERGVYLITGGLGGVGLEVAAYLAGAVRARLALVGRRGLPSRDQWDGWLRSHAAGDPISARIESIRRIEAAGGEVLVLSADVAKSDEAMRAVGSAEQFFGPVDGVIHAAGVPGGALIERQTRQSSDAVFAPKIAGTLNLCAAFAGRQLDFFVLCSSLRSWMGAPGRVEYCAANAFLDAAAQQPGFLPARLPISIAWDNWAETGMGMWSGQGAELIADESANAMTNAEGVAAFRAILSNPNPALVVSTADLTIRLEEHRRLTTERALESFAAARPSVSAHSRPELEAEYVEPSTPVERSLAAIWQDLLGIDRVGVHDNFFELGGDSVVAIQVVARAHCAGLNLTPTQMFQHQTVAALAELASTATATVSAEQSTVTGELPLTPIQRWFFDQGFAEPNHFSLAVLFRARERLDVDHLRAAVSRVQSHHDALRLRFRRDREQWIQTNAGEDVPAPLEVRDLSSVSGPELQAALERECTAAHASLNIMDGPVFKVVLLNCGPEQPQRVLVTLHHLVSDLVTLAIVTEDLQTAYRQMAAGRTVSLPVKTTSFRDWSHHLAQIARSGYFDGESDYWTAAPRSTVAPLPVTRSETAAGRAESSARIAFAGMSPEETQALVYQVPMKLKTQMLPILLAGLVDAVTDWAGAASLLVDVEGLGREGIGGSVDLSRTVGWFTPMYPMYFARVNSITESIRSVSAALKELPNHGLGYGALRYLTGNAEIEERLRTMLKAEISFLYRGAPEFSASSGDLLSPASDPCGNVHASSTFLTHRIAADVAVGGGTLGVRLVYSADDYDAETMDTLAARFIDVLRAVVRSTLTGPEPTAVQLDADEFGLADSDVKQITAWLASTAAN